VIQHAVKHVEVTDEVAAAQDRHHVIGDNGELDLPMSDMLETADAAHAPSPSLSVTILKITGP
jgi:hypothetical protein